MKELQQNILDGLQPGSRMVATCAQRSKQQSKDKKRQDGAQTALHFGPDEPVKTSKPSDLNK